VGTVLGGRYEILALLGQGGMGAVYKAQDRAIERTVAIKMVLPELATGRSALLRFKQELILAREITHKNVVRIYDLVEADGLTFITMEFVEGESLSTVLHQRGRLPVGEAVEVMRQMCAGLQAAHEKGVIHRDLKPANIMRDSHGRIVLMDFGLARTAESSGMTVTGALVGTVEYMSPEQAKSAAVDARSDLFALGLIFYEMLTGQRPYQADSAIASLLKRTRERAPALKTLDATVPRALSDICAKCLEIDPKQRYQNANELLADLDAWQRGAGPSIGAIARRMRPRLRRRHAAVPALALLLVLAALFVPRLRLKPAAEHPPVSVLVADFTNHTGDPVFDGTLEPMFNVALEGASFVNAFNRGTARKLARKLPQPTDKLDEQPARLVAVSEGVSAVISGEISRRGDNYSISAMALDAVSGNVLAKAEVTTTNKDEVLHAIPKLVAPIRKALGDTTPESVQFNAITSAFAAASLEVVHLDAIAMEQQFAGKFAEALQSYSKAAELDPNFARAYVGMSAMSFNLGNLKDAEKYIKLAMAHEDRMTERERYRYRGLFYLAMGNWQKCIEENTQLLDRYPADNMGQGNLAGCLAEARNFPKAVEAARRVVEIVPKGALQRQTLSFLSSASGDFQGGEREARATIQFNPSSEPGHLMLAEAQLGQGQLAQAAETYHKLEKLSGLGASLAAAGLGDLELYEGRFGDAVRTLELGAAADLAAKRPDAAANKFAALAYTQLLRQQKRQSIAGAEEALAHSQAVSIRFLAARIFVEVGEVAKAHKLAVGLGSELNIEPQAYAKIIQGKAALGRGNAPEAIKAFTEANNLLDTWIGHLELGRAYLQARAFVEADSEFDRCLKRRGEALELFMDNTPTYGYLPSVYYYQGLVREGMRSAGFVDSYRTYLSIRSQAGEDPLLPEVRRRAGQ
jgi:tetratricopeptide (TPR) repeat protein